MPRKTGLRYQITKWLPECEIGWLKSEKVRLAKKGAKTKIKNRIRREMKQFSLHYTNGHGVEYAIGPK